MKTIVSILLLSALCAGIAWSQEKTANKTCTEGVFTFKAPSNLTRIQGPRSQSLKSQMMQGGRELAGASGTADPNLFTENSLTFFSAYELAGGDSLFILLGDKSPVEMNRDAMFNANSERIRWGKNSGRLSGDSKGVSKLEIDGIPTLLMDIVSANGERLQTYTFFVPDHPEHSFAITFKSPQGKHQATIDGILGSLKITRAKASAPSSQSAPASGSSQPKPIDHVVRVPARDQDWVRRRVDRSSKEDPKAGRSAEKGEEPSSSETAPPIKSTLDLNTAARGTKKYCIFDGLKLRTAPEPSADGDTHLKAGQEIQVLSEDDGGLLVKTAEGAQGWVHPLALVNSQSAAQQALSRKPPPNALFVVTQFTGQGNYKLAIWHGGLLLPRGDLSGKPIVEPGNCVGIPEPTKGEFRGPYTVLGQRIDSPRFDTLYIVDADQRLVLLQPTGTLAFRIWTNKDGRHVDAAFLSLNDGIVAIHRKSDGKTFSIPLAQLSSEDQTWVTDNSGDNKAGASP